ncbi:MAG TPA: cellulase family glycosylhydrolase, partial [Chloroflexota bacterium]|nr:cellulase family glycosylhydrolase [Chloroflexota bacterium]
MSTGALTLGQHIGPSSSASSTVHAATIGLHVQGNRLVNASNQPVTLRGANRSGTEYSCLGGPNFADGPTDAASVQAMASWGLNTVRVPLNEDCWLGINGVAVGGAIYQQDIKSWVDTLTQNGMYVILDLHWSAPGGARAVGQQPMA